MPPGARHTFRTVVGAWGDEELIEQAFTIEEYDASSTVEIGPLTATFAEVPHFILTHAVNLVSSAGRFTFGADCRPCDELVEAARDTDLLFVEATLPRPERTGIRGHLTPGEAGDHARLAGARRVVLTHISDELDAEWAREEAEQAYGGELSVARGGMFTSCRLAARRSAERRAPSGGRAKFIPCLPATSESTSTACGARWTSCSATRSRSSGRASRAPQPGFSPRVDVYYCGDEPRAVVKAELAGVDIDTVSLEVAGRELVISGERPVAETEGRVYQQVEIEAGAFRRVVELGADVVADRSRAAYEDGILRVELPLAGQVTRRVPIDTNG